MLAARSTRPAAGFIVLAVQPGERSRVWLDFDSPPSFETGQQLVGKIGAVKPFEVRSGPVVVALKVGLWDAFESKRIAPSPAEWKAVTHKAGKQLEIDELMDQLWREGRSRAALGRAALRLASCASAGRTGAANAHCA